jgi:phosphoribosylamine--glycine ligase
MGAYAPAPLITPELMAQVVETVLQPAVDGLRAEGKPYVGILYAGLMLTETGLRVLEFNCRFGDPETQVVLPLLGSDLVEIMLACLAGSLDQLTVDWRDGAAATVVAASGGYPGAYQKGRVISGVEQIAQPDTVVFHAGTHRAEDGQLLTSGGRVLAVTGLGDSLTEALRRAYAGIELIQFDGIYYRRDIGAKALS